MKTISFWSKINVTVRDLEVFKHACMKNDVRYDDVTGLGLTHMGFTVKARLWDAKSNGVAFLMEDGGAYRVSIDNDARYSSITHRLGQNAGILMRDYTQAVVEKSVYAQGGQIVQRISNPDGSIILKMAVNS